MGSAPVWPSRYLWEFSISFEGEMKNWQGFGYWYVDWVQSNWRLDETFRVDLDVPDVPQPLPFMTTWSGPQESV
jgi:hypothetical protein